MVRVDLPLTSAVPEIAEIANPLTARLSDLLLGRLPAEIVVELMELLPEGPTSSLRKDVRHAPDPSISFIAFTEHSRHLLGLTDLADLPRYRGSDTGEALYSNLCNQVAEAFLLAFARELPPDLKARIEPHLPGDLRCRMDLYCGFTDSDKVA